MNCRTLVLVSIALLILTSACTNVATQSVSDAVVMTPAMTPAITPGSLKVNLQVIEAIELHLDDLDAEFLAFPLTSKLERDYYDAAEIDAMEGLLFRFLTMQTSLWDIVNAYGGLDARFPDDDADAKAQILSIAATLLIAKHTALIVEHFANDAVAIKLMNAAYYRSEIPFGTYDRMRENVTSAGVLDAVANAKALYQSELDNPQSALRALSESGSAYAGLITRMPALHDQAQLYLQQVAKYFPSYAETEKLAKQDSKGQHKNLYAIRSWLFKEVSRLKNPAKHVLVFTDAQKQQILSLLEPGDLVLTYTAGYMSDVFIPGAFKHGITFIGTAEDRAAMGMSAQDLPDADRFEPQQVAANLQHSTLPDGTNADIIEAVAEGVIFNNLEHIMDTHVNRMLVLRPRLSAEQRAAFLLEVYSYLGDGYDFRFDFADASQQVCTEVIYRAINGKGAIDFSLTVRAGHETLSADDIANYHLDVNTEAFDFVMLIVSDTDSNKNAALVTTGAEGEDKLKALMAEAKK